MPKNKTTAPAPEETQEKAEAVETTPTEEKTETVAEAGEKKPEEAEEAEEAENADQTIEALRRQIAQTGDQLLRTMAEYENFRRRSQKEKEAIYTDTRAEIIGKLLPVLDNFERAAAADSDPDAYRKGVGMILKQMQDIFAAMGVEAFGARGDAFDPNLHSGVMHEEDETLGENTISEVLMRGYKMADKLIRPATVKVAN